MRQSGQAVLLILLVVAVALGLGLSIIAQSTTDVKITEREQESARAFNAAEAGIEQALKDLSQPGGSLTVNGVDVNYGVSGQNFLEGRFRENESTQVVLGGKANTVTVEWVDKNNGEENPGNCAGVSAQSGQTAASLIITVVKTNYQVRRYGLNACALAASNNLTDVTTAGTDNYLRSYQLAVTANDQLVRVLPLYNSVSLRLTAANPLPDQAYLISSSAQVTDTKETKAIEVTRLEPATPSIFDYVLFSGGGLVK